MAAAACKAFRGLYNPLSVPTCIVRDVSDAVDTYLGGIG